METINRMPKWSLEDIMYRTALAARVLEGLEDAETGRLITTGELLERVEE